MKIQLAYRFTGEDENKLIGDLKRIVSVLKDQQFEVYCPVLNPDRPKNKKELFLDTLNKIRETDILLALIKSDNKSEGMLMEIGHAMGLGKKFFVAINKEIKDTHLREMADLVIEFKDINDLCNKLKKLKH